MTIRLIKCLAFIASLLFVVSAHAAPDSKGTEFIFAFQNNHPGAGKLLLFVTGEQNTQGLVEVPGYQVTPGVSFSEAFTIVANQVTTIELPTAIRQLPANGSASLGVHLVADDEVTVYGVNLQQYTTDAFLALPVDVLSNEYIVMSYDGLAQFASLNLSSQVAVVANVDNTLVEITPAADVAGQLAGQPFTVVLNRFDVYQLSTNIEDLTGTVIRSSDPVAVMGGQKCADVPSLERSPTGGRIGWCDHLVEMMPPLNTWGQSFAVIPLATRLKGSIVRMMAAENGTRVKFGETPSDVATLNQGEFVETVLTDFTEIVATGPILVTQYSPGQAFDNVATDPFMMLIPPNEQFLQSYTFATPENSFDKHFVNIAVPTTAVSSVLLDGVALDASLFSLIGGSGLSGAQIPITEGSHTLTADQTFGIYVYGFNSYDSYGYPGGMALAETNPLGDSYAPNIGPLRQIGRTLLGTASDSEDINVNGLLDAGEDINNNGILDRRSEDTNGNGSLDAGEDINANGILDRDRGVFKLELLPGTTNLTFQVTEFVAGQSPLLNFRLDLIDTSFDGAGRLRVEDLNGNATEIDVYISAIAVLSDVQLVSTVSGDRVEVDQATFSHPPVSVDVQTDKTVINWQFANFSADQIENVGFDVVLLNPEPNEQRLVTQNVELSYINAPGGQRITTVLGPQTVLVSDTEFDLQTSTDRSNYGPNEDVQLQALVNNVGTANNSGTVEFIVEDINGLPIVSFAARAFGPLLPATSVAINESWNTSLFIAGAYRLHTLLKDTDGRVTNEAFSAFSIVNSTVGLPVAQLGITVGVPIDGGNVFIEKQTYHTTDAVQIQTRITNKSINTLLNDTLLRVTVLGPSGSPVFAQDTPVDAELVPGAVTDILSSFMLDDAAQGTYQVQVTYIDNVTSATIATESRQFSVARNIALSVSGQVVAAFDELLLGDTQECTDTINSLVAQPLVDLPVQKNLVNIANQQEVNQSNSLVTIAANGTLVDVRNETTSGVAGDFACVLRVNTGTDFQTIGFDTFSVYNLIADPGADQMALVGQQVQLDASGSRETDGLPLTNNWRFVSIPFGSNTTFSDATAVNPSFFVDEQGLYVIELIVNNGTEDSLPKQVRVTVPNRVAIADAGPDQAVAVNDIVLLDASGSFDLDGDPLQYEWTIVQKPEGSASELSDATVSNPTMPIDIQGVYRVELVVNDGFEDSAPDTVLLNVGNVPPVADAGVDIAALLGDTVTLDGTSSSDANGDLLSFAWFFDSVPLGSNATLTNSATARPLFTIDLAGDYVVRLVVNDGLSSSTPDTVTVSVGNAAPVANAGSDQSGSVGDLITLDGSASNDPNNDPLLYRWNLIGKPTGSNAQLVNQFSVNPQFVLDVQGDYIIQLIVNDGTVDSQPDTVFITVGNLRPFADPFFDEVGDIFTGRTISLDGFDSFDPDGDPITYQWTFVDRPAGSLALFDDATSPTPSFVLDVAGDYIVQLVVNDGQIDSEPATVFIEGVLSCIDNLEIRPKFDKITLTWDFNPEVEFVEIERATSLEGPYEVIAESESTYATYLDAGLAFGPVYYYRIQGVFPQDNVIECRDVGEGAVCLGDFCNYVFDERENISLQCGEVTCQILEFGDGIIIAQCNDFGPSLSFGLTNSCPPEDGFCQEVCDYYAVDPEGAVAELGGDFDFELCLSPVTEQRFCQTQTIASTPIGRIRTVQVPDLTGLTVEQAQQVLEQNRLVLGEVTFERTTAIPLGQIIRQDVPRNSIMPPNTAINLVIATRGVTN